MQEWRGVMSNTYCTQVVPTRPGAGCLQIGDRFVDEIEVPRHAAAFDNRTTFGREVEDHG
jgi:hypothetical protein